MGTRLPRRLLPLLLAVLPAACDRGGDGLLRLPGTVVSASVEVLTPSGGTVLGTPAAPGSRVREGDPLLRLDLPELRARREQASARVAEEAAALERSRRGPRGTDVEEARAAAEAAAARLRRLRAGPREEELRAARSELSGAEGELERAEKEFAGKRELYAAAALTRERFEAARALRDAAAARRDEAKARLELVAAGPRAEEVEEAAAEAARLETRLRHLEEAGRPEALAATESRLAEARARLAEIDAGLEGAVLRSPLDGILESLAAGPGDVLRPGAAVARVRGPGGLSVLCVTSAAEGADLAEGSPATVRAEGVPAEGLPGRVLEREPADGGRVRVRFAVEDPMGLLRPGIPATVEVAKARRSR